MATLEKLENHGDADKASIDKTLQALEKMSKDTQNPEVSLTLMTDYEVSLTLMDVSGQTERHAHPSAFSI